MYTLEMAQAFKKIKPPKNFGIVIYDNDKFITLEINPEQLTTLTKKEAIAAVNYINEVKKTFESFDAIVFIVRDTIEKENNDD